MSSNSERQISNECLIEIQCNCLISKISFLFGIHCEVPQTHVCRVNAILQITFPERQCNNDMFARRSGAQYLDSIKNYKIQNFFIAGQSC